MKQIRIGDITIDAVTEREGHAIQCREPDWSSLPDRDAKQSAINPVLPDRRPERGRK